MKTFRIAKDKNCPETLQITAFSGHFLYRCQHGEDALPPGVLHRPVSYTHLTLPTILRV